MSLVDFLKDLDESVKTVNSPDFDVEIVETDFVPSFSDSSITYDNHDTKKKKCKRLESCVLYVDIRNSAKISASKRPKTLAKVYSSFVSSMLSCARYYGGHVRNIIGDRVMVVFDKQDCYTNAVDTAILMNTVCEHILNKRISSFEFSAGIGIDHGEMLITKSGAIKQGDEKEFYRTLVWLGKPANVASRLTDLANKEVNTSEQGVREGLYFPLTNVWNWQDRTYEEFLNSLETTHSPKLIHNEEYFSSFYLTTINHHRRVNSPILMTENVYKGYKAARPNSKEVKNGWFSEIRLDVRDYQGKVFGGNVYKKAVEDI
ncbi:adenylate/guanylate cyclase domain-containing protein [Vibrio pelagius]|uniref:adenylate/guanylate cyclase domain-containing protein n=1 Tax=Vibrio pelagius TaxID=28169 RepID=UPI00354C2972